MLDKQQQLYQQICAYELADPSYEIGFLVLRASEEYRKYVFLPLVWRSAMVPLCHLGNMLWFFPFMAGLLLRQLSFSPLLIWTGIGMFAAVVVFHLITLPTEFNASNRAETVLASTGIVSTQQEADGGNGYWMQPRSPTWRPRGHPCCS